MDWVTAKRSAMEYIQKYRYVLLLLLIGVFLMNIPESEKDVIKTDAIVAETEPSLQESLEEILGNIAGAGKVAVLLTEASGTETVYQTDEDISVEETSSDIRRETVLTTDTNRNETGVVRQINPPIYRGAIILCQGADSANIRLSIVEAVMSVTGLTSDRITVLKMK